MLCTELAYCERSIVVAGDGGGDGSVTAVSAVARLRRLSGGVVWVK